MLLMMFMMKMMMGTLSGPCPGSLAPCPGSLGTLPGQPGPPVCHGAIEQTYDALVCDMVAGAQRKVLGPGISPLPAPSP